MRTLDEITRELADLQDELLAADPSDLTSLSEIRSRQAELRAEAQRFSELLDDPRSTAEIRRELDQHRDRLKALRNQQIDLVKQSSAGSGTARDALPEATLNRKLKDASGAADIERRIAQLEQALEDRS